MNIKDWLDRATEKIGFDPDREAVRRELEDHLQDRQERYAARGLAPEEAEAAAVADMGDAADIAEELGKLHRPFWGYLWTFSKLLLGLAFILILIRVLGGLEGWSVERIKSWHLYEGYYDFTVASRQRLPGSVTVGNYTVSASAVLLEPADEGEQWFCLSLRFVPHIIWERVNLAYLHREFFDNGITDGDGRQYCMKNGGLKDAAGIRGVIFDYLEFFIRPEDGKLPEWVDIPLGKSDYTLRVDLEEGVSLP